MADEGFLNPNPGKTKTQDCPHPGGRRRCLGPHGPPPLVVAESSPELGDTPACQSPSRWESILAPRHLDTLGGSTSGDLAL